MWVRGGVMIPAKAVFYPTRGLDSVTPPTLPLGPHTSIREITMATQPDWEELLQGAPSQQIRVPVVSVVTPPEGSHDIPSVTRCSTDYHRNPPPPPKPLNNFWF